MNKEEKGLIKEFRKAHIPGIFKLDNTDCILFLEDVDFDVCKWLLKGTALSKETIDSVLNEYERLLSFYPLNKQDDKELNDYLLLLDKVMQIFKKRYILD